MMDSTELPGSSTRVLDGSEEPAGTHDKIGRSTGEVPSAVGCRDDRPIVDSGSVVSTTNNRENASQENVCQTRG